MIRFLLSLFLMVGFAASADVAKNCYLKPSLVHTDSTVYFHVYSSDKEGGGQRVEFAENTRLRDAIELIDDAAVAGACDADHARSSYFDCECSVEIQGDKIYKLRGCDVEGQPTYVMIGLRSGGIRGHLEFFREKGYCRK